MTETQIQGAALVAMLIALPLLSWGSTQQVTVAMVTGGTLIALAVFSMIAARYTDLEED